MELLFGVRAKIVQIGRVNFLFDEIFSRSRWTVASIFTVRVAGIMTICHVLPTDECKWWKWCSPVNVAVIRECAWSKRCEKFLCSCHPRGRIYVWYVVPPSHPRLTTPFFTPLFVSFLFSRWFRFDREMERPTSSRRSTVPTCRRMAQGRTHALWRSMGDPMYNGKCKRCGERGTAGEEAYETKKSREYRKLRREDLVKMLVFLVGKPMCPCERDKESRGWYMDVAFVNRILSGSNNCIMRFLRFCRHWKNSVSMFAWRKTHQKKATNINFIYMYTSYVVGWWCCGEWRSGKHCAISCVGVLFCCDFVPQGESQLGEHGWHASAAIARPRILGAQVRQQGKFPKVRFVVLCILSIIFTSCVCRKHRLRACLYYYHMHRFCTCVFWILNRVPGFRPVSVASHGLRRAEADWICPCSFSLRN